MSYPGLDHVKGYLAMYDFLNLLWERKDDGWDELACMLGSMSLLSDGTPADRGYVQDWDNALEAATGRKRGYFDPLDISRAMLSFLKTYDSRGASDEFRELVVRLTGTFEADATRESSQIWQDWAMCVERAKADKVDAWLRLKK